MEGGEGGVLLLSASAAAASAFPIHCCLSLAAYTPRRTTPPPRASFITATTLVNSRTAPLSAPPNASSPIFVRCHLSKRPSPGSDTPENGLLPPDDAAYLAKLSLGCIVGAAVIKYGSVLAPGSTRPNLAQALFMIGLPILVGVALLVAVRMFPFLRAKMRN